MKKWSESVGKKQEINGKKLQNGVFNVSFDRFQASIPFSSPLKIFDFLMCSWGIRREYWFGKSLVLENLSEFQIFLVRLLLLLQVVFVSCRIEENSQPSH